MVVFGEGRRCPGGGNCPTFGECDGVTRSWSLGSQTGGDSSSSSSSRHRLGVLAAALIHLGTDAARARRHSDRECRR